MELWSVTCVRRSVPGEDVGDVIQGHCRSNQRPWIDGSARVCGDRAVESRRTAQDADGRYVVEGQAARIDRAWRRRYSDKCDMAARLDQLDRQRGHVV